MTCAGNRWKTRIRSLAIVLAVATSATACGGEAAPEATPLRGWDGEVLAPGESLAETAATEATPDEALAFSEEEVAPPKEAKVPEETEPPETPSPGSLPVSNDELRVTADGIKVTVYEDPIDFGDGPEDAWWIEGDHKTGGLAGSTFTPGPAETDTIDSRTWAASGRIFVVRVEVAARVTEVLLTSGEGSVDRVAPDATQFAVLSVLTDNHETSTLDALDASGGVVGSCYFDDTYGMGILTCTD